MGGRGSRIVEYRTDPALVQQLAALRKEQEELFKKHLVSVEQKKELEQKVQQKEAMLKDMEDPVKYFEHRKQTFEKTLNNLKEHPIQASMIDEYRNKKNIAFVAATCHGKTSLANTIAKRMVGEEGIDETTKQVAPLVALPGEIVIWDFPGFNDEVDYLDVAYLALLKSFTRIYVLYSTDLKACTNCIKLLDALGVPIGLVRTKCDNTEDPRKTNLSKVKEELQNIKKKEIGYLTTLGLRSLPKIYHISARNARHHMKILEFEGIDSSVPLGGLYDWSEFTLDLASS